MKELVYSIYILSAIVSIVLMVVGMLWYTQETKNKNNKPNIIVLFLWALLAIINTITYYLIVDDLWKAGLSFTSVAANIYVLIILMLHKNYILLKRDILLVGIGIVVIMGFVVSMNIKEIHIILQIVNTLSYIPLIIGIVDNKGKEPLGPWVVIYVASIANLVTVFAHYSDYWSLINPIRSLCLQTIVIILIKIKEMKSVPVWGTFFYK